MGRISRKKHQKCKVAYLGLPYEEKELGTIYNELLLTKGRVHFYLVSYILYNDLSSTDQS